MRDHKGAWIHGFWSCEVSVNAFMAELGALHEGLSMAWKFGYRDILVEVDSKEVLQAVRNKETYVLCPQAREVAELIQRNWCVSLQWIPRECNSVVDCLAKLGVATCLIGVYFSESPPVEAEPFILRDSFSC